MRDLLPFAFAFTFAFALGCAAERPAPNSSALGVGARPDPSEASLGPVAPRPSGDSSRPSAIAPGVPDGVLAPRPEPCEPSDWAPRTLPALLERGLRGDGSREARASAPGRAFEAECSDAPDQQPRGPGAPTLLDGVEIRLSHVVDAGLSGRRWPGNQCSFELRLASGAGQPLRLGPDQVPPFNAITSLVRSGTAVWLELSFNGYTREFPRGGNRVVAADLCDGRIAWISKDSTANGGLLLLGDYLVTAFGFTSERRYVYVLDARGGGIVQKLPVVENICPSKAWAPNHGGGRCDAPGQRVGAATSPRVEDGLLLVDTNTGSAAFEFR